MKKLIILFSISMVCAYSSFAQNDVDAMRYSQLTFGGTARFSGMAGSMGALGGDMSTISVNPAGIGVFRKTELCITPSFYTTNSTSVFNGTSSGDSKLNVNLGNIGLVGAIHLKEDKNGGWNYINFGLGYNRLANFNNRLNIVGDNKNSSMLDAFIQQANGLNPSQLDAFSTNLAYQTYLINPLSYTDTTHYNHVLMPRYGEQQKKSVDSRGSLGEMYLSLGANYKDKLYIGGALGLVHADYSEESAYSETDVKDSIHGFKSFTYYQTLASKGGMFFNGVNFKLGVIVKPIDWLRVGLAVHTPTYIKFKDQYSSVMQSNLDSVSHQSDTVKGKFNYSITTPFRAVGSLGFVLDKIGMLNVEYEYINYSTASLNSHPNVFGDINTSIHNNYKATGNIKIGAEVRLDPVAFRVGYALYGSPYKSGDNANATRSSYTFGIGYRRQVFYIDAAYVFSKYSEKNYLYDSALLDPVATTYKSSSFMITCGWRF
jgi:hypothetical protein